MSTDRILSHICDLYNLSDKQKDEMLNNFDSYEKAFNCYGESEVIKAVNEYWRYKNDKSRPRLSQILAMLSSDNKVEKQELTVAKINEPKAISVAAQWIERDKSLGTLRHMTSVYETASKLAMKDLLIEKIGLSQWQPLSEYQRYELALRNGLFTAELLVQVCREKFGKDYNWQGSNELGNIQNRNNLSQSVSNLAKKFQNNYKPNVWADNDVFNLAEEF